MATATTSTPTTTQAEITREQFDELIEFVRDYYREELATLLQRYPKDQTTFEISYRDLESGVTMPGWPRADSFAEAYLKNPPAYDEHLTTALNEVDMPIDRDLSEATVQIVDLPEWYTHYPGQFSPTDEAGNYRSVIGEVSKATDVYSKITEAAFECQRCGTLTRIPQTDGDFQEPHQCQGCERQGPFDINSDQSGLVDAQKLRLQTPPEIAQGNSADIDVFVEEPLTDVASVGDRVTVSGTIHLEQKSSGNKKTGVFYPYVDGRHIELEETDHTDLDISAEEREQIRELASGEHGDPLDLAGASLAPKIHGYDEEKRMIILAMVGGARTEYPTGDADRGEFHILLLGDPGTGKSKLIDRAEQLGWRTVGVSGKRATTPGLTAGATQDDFGDGDWTLEAGAFVKANGGVVCIDELDDMPADVRAAMLEPMSKQSIHVSTTGISANLTTQTAVIGAGNPKGGRFNPYEPLPEQFDLGSTLLSRFDLIYTMQDQPDADEDKTVSEHILSTRDAAKRQMRGLDIDEEAAESVEPPVEEDILRKWIALAKQADPPVFASKDVERKLRDSFVEMRGIHDYDENSPVPVTFRKLEGIVRVAEAAAKFEFSDVITHRHAKIATQAVGKSMRDFGRDEDGNYDADVQETGQSMAQKQKMQLIGDIITELQREYDDGHAPYDEVVERAVEEGLGHNDTENKISKMKSEGAVYEPAQGHLKFVGLGQ